MVGLQSQRIALSGNPFVDTGLATIAALAGLDDIRDLTLSAVSKVHGSGSDLAHRNARLKSFSQIFGTNNPLLQTGYGYKKGTGASPKNFAVYEQTLSGFLGAIHQRLSGRRCEACGTPTAFDFARTCKEAVETVGGKAPEDKWIGRDWFPLAGSLGSDAQALPGGSRTVHLCSTCLLAVQYLPLAAVLLNGRLAVFQSTATDFWYELVRNLVDEVMSRVQAGNNETLGAKEGSKAVIGRLLGAVDQLQKAGRVPEIPVGASLYVWRFSNSGAAPDCRIEELPNPALRFLWTVVQYGLRSEVEKIVASEGKQERPLFRCVAEQSDYSGLYPSGKYPGASPRLFALYQALVRQRSPHSLEMGLILAREGVAGMKEKDIIRLARKETFSDGAARSRFRRVMTQMVRTGAFRLDDYLDLFRTDGEATIATSRSDGWKIVRYYMHHLSEEIAVRDPVALSYHGPTSAGLLTYCARAIFSAIVKVRGRARFDAEVVGRISRAELGISWLMRQFTALAEDQPGFTFGAFEQLCIDSDGRSTIRELLFQMSLLWLEWLNGKELPAAMVPLSPGGSGLPKWVEAALAQVALVYDTERGLSRLERDVLQRLRRRELGLEWFRARLVGDDDGGGTVEMLSHEKWEEFLVSDGGRPRREERLFQCHLFLANLYRQRRASEVEVRT